MTKEEQRLYKEQIEDTDVDVIMDITPDEENWLHNKPDPEPRGPQAVQEEDDGN